MLSHFTDAQLADRVSYVETLIVRETDWKNLPYLNQMFQRLIEEQARRDIEKEEK
jgi:hypothetical protein